MGPTFRRFLTCTARRTLVPEQPSRGQWQRGPRVSGPCGDGPTRCWNSWPGAPALLGDSVYSGTPLTPGPEPPNPCPTGALRPRNQLPARFSHTPSLPRCSRWQAWGRVQQTLTIQRRRLTEWPRRPRHLSLRWRAAHCTAFRARSACLGWRIPGPIPSPDGGSPGGGKGRVVDLVSTRNPSTSPGCGGKNFQDSGSAPGPLGPAWGAGQRVLASGLPVLCRGFTLSSVCPELPGGTWLTLGTQSPPSFTSETLTLLPGDPGCPVWAVHGGVGTESLHCRVSAVAVVRPTGAVSVRPTGAGRLLDGSSQRDAAGRVQVAGSQVQVSRWGGPGPGALPHLSASRLRRGGPDSGVGAP